MYMYTNMYVYIYIYISTYGLPFCLPKPYNLHPYRAICEFPSAEPTREADRFRSIVWQKGLQKRLVLLYLYIDYSLGGPNPR